MAGPLNNQTEPIPGYRLLERLGRGGFGEVWKAEAPGGLHKAIKFVFGNLIGSKEDGVAAEQELKALRRVQTVRHPFILSLERYDIIDGQLIIVMELADRNLWDRYTQCRTQGLVGIPREELLRYMDEAAEALDLMNKEYQLQHLDIKPQNLFLVHNHIKVADFGLVKDLEGMKATVTGGVTPLYAAPETFDGWISRYSDQYSLAIVYQELLTGKRPFPGTNARQLIMQHLQAVPDLTSLSPGDREAVGRALAKTPQDRHPDCTTLVRALRAGGSTATPSAAAPPALAAAPPRPDTDPSSCQTDEDRRDRPGAPLSDPMPMSLTSRPTAMLNTIARPEVRDTQLPSGQRRAPPHAQGDGVLFPALVIGLGQMGLAVLQQLREGLQAAFGPTKDVREALPNLRLLYIDTDPDGLRLAAEGGPARALDSQEILLTRLNRPSHYLKPADRLAALQTWFDPQMLFRIPRSPVTTGLRALGRLAFFDNFSTVSARLRVELDSCTDPDALKEADRNTRLGIRSNWPRVYVVTSLAGGTGSGIFLDLAYVLRHQLKQVGYDRPDLVGIFLLPELERQASRPMALGNAFASLTELGHFSSPGVTYTARLGDKGGFVSDADQPFNRCVLVPSAVENAEDLSRTAGLAGGYLLRDLTTPVGRVVEDRCRGIAATASQPLLSTIGVQRLSWPRQTILRRMVRGLCLRLVRHWMNKDAAPVKDQVQAWVAEQWVDLRLEPIHLMDRLERSCEKALGQMAESAFAQVTGPLAQRGPNPPELDANQATQILSQLVQLVGHPKEETKGLHVKVIDALDEATRKLAGRCEQKLAHVAVHLLEQPHFRLAGAEEAIRQLSVKLQQIVNTQADSAAQIAADSIAVYEHLHTLIKSLAGASAAKRRPIAAELLELIPVYPRKQYQALLLERVASVYRGMLANCPEYLREIGFCRARLGDLQKSLEARPLADRLEVDLGPGRALLPASCRTLDAVVEQQLQTITPEELLDFDQQVQTVVRTQFKALVNVCMSANNLLKDLEVALDHEAELAVAQRLGKARVVDIYLEQNADPERAQEAMTRTYREAEPALATPVAAGEVNVLAVPADPNVERLRGLVKRVLPQVTVLPRSNSNDIVYFREQLGLRLAELPQLGPAARAAYEQLIAVEHFTPHNRIDIDSWDAVPQLGR